MVKEKQQQVLHEKKRTEISIENLRYLKKMLIALVIPFTIGFYLNILGLPSWINLVALIGCLEALEKYYFWFIK